MLDATVVGRGVAVDLGGPLHAGVGRAGAGKVGTTSGRDILVRVGSVEVSSVGGLPLGLLLLIERCLAISSE